MADNDTPVAVDTNVDVPRPDHTVSMTDRMQFIAAITDMMNELMDQLVTEHFSDEPQTALSRERTLCGVKINLNLG